MERRLRIFMLISYLNYSGACQIFLWVAGALAQRGHEVHVVSFRDFSEDFEFPKNVQGERFDSKKKGIIAKLRVVRKRMKEQKPDVSISFLLDSNVYNILMCLGLPTKSVVCERNDPFKPRYHVLHFWKPLFRYADGAVFQLDGAKKYYNNIKGLTAVIPNPIRQRPQISLKPIRERTETFVTHGRLDLFQKRQDVLIDAFSLLLTRHPEYKLLIYGSGRDEARIRDYIDTLGLGDNILLMGLKHHVEEHICKSKFYVFSSDFEGMPNALMEAMSLGLPCVSTDCSPGGAAVLIENGVNGSLVPRGDAKKLSDKMCYLVEHQDEAERMGYEATKICDTLNPERIINLWEDYLLKLIKNWKYNDETPQ